jgi:DNA invertase Pin-like site-specific DNA recombinase
LNEHSEERQWLRAAFVSYLRVSTDKQGKSGLGLEAQRKAVEDFLNGGRWELIEEFIEVESGKRDDRPKLAEALARCRLHNAVLVIAKLDRLSRDAHFLLGLQKAGVRFVAADMPEANEMVVGIMAVVAQAERKMISQRTKAALAAAKARGQRLGTPGNLRNQDSGRVQGRAKRTMVAGERAADLKPIIADLRAGGASSLRQIAAGLNRRGIPTARGRSWSAVQVKRVLERA